LFDIKAIAFAVFPSDANIMGRLMMRKRILLPHI